MILRSGRGLLCEHVVAVDARPLNLLQQMVRSWILQAKFQKKWQSKRQRFLKNLAGTTSTKNFALSDVLVLITRLCQSGLVSPTNNVRNRLHRCLRPTRFSLTSITSGALETATTRIYLKPKLGRPLLTRFLSCITLCSLSNLLEPLLDFFLFMIKESADISYKPATDQQLYPVP